MVLEKWKLIIRNWLNCYSDEANKDCNVNIEKLTILVTHLLQNQDTRKSYSNDCLLEKFILDIYPDFSFDNGKIIGQNEDEIYINASLLLYFVCVKSKDVDLKNIMCDKLDLDDQDVITKFNKTLIQSFSVTYKEIQAAILESCGQDTASAISNHVPVAETPPVLRSLHSEVRRLQAALDAERFDRNFLQDELTRTNYKLEKLIKDKEQYKSEIVSLKAKISNCGQEIQSDSSDISSHVSTVKLLRQLEETEQRLVDNQSQLDDAIHERNIYKTKVDELKLERDKLIIINQQESLRNTSLEEQISVEKKTNDSLKELVNELRQHNKFNQIDGSLLECDDLNSSIQSLGRNISISSEACSNVVEVQLMEERANIIELKHKIDFLENKIQELNKKASDEKLSLLNDLQSKDCYIQHLQHEIDEGIKKQYLLKDSFNDETSKLNNQINELEQKVKDYETLHEEESSLLKSLSDKEQRLNNELDIMNNEISKLKEGLIKEQNSKSKMREEYESIVMKLNEKVLNRNNELVEMQNTLLKNSEDIEMLNIKVRDEKKISEELKSKYNNDVAVLSEEKIELNNLIRSLQQQLTNETTSLNSTKQALNEIELLKNNIEQGLQIANESKSQLQQELEHSKNIVNTLQKELKHISEDFNIQRQNFEEKLIERDSNFESLSTKFTDTTNSFKESISNLEKDKSDLVTIVKEKDNTITEQVQTLTELKQLIGELQKDYDQLKTLSDSTKECLMKEIGLKQELEHQFKNIKLEKESVEAQNDKHIQLNKQLSEKCSNYEIEIKNVEQNLIVVQNEKATLCNEINVLKTKYEVLEEDKYKLKQTVEEKTEEYKLLIKENLLLKENIEIKIKEFSELREKIKLINEENIKVKNEKEILCDEINNLKRNFEVLKDDKFKLDQTVKEKTEKYNVLCDEKLLLEQDLKTKNEEFTGLKSEIKLLEQTLIDVQNEKDVLCNEINNIKNQYEVLEECKCKYEQIIKEKTEEYIILSEEKLSLKQEVKNKNEEILKLKDEFVDLEENFIDVQNERKTLCNNINNLKNRCEELEEGKFISERIIKEKAEDHIKLNEKLILLEQDMKNKNEEVLELKNEIKLLNEKLIDDQNRKEKLCCEINNLKKKCEVLEEGKLDFERIIKKKAEEYMMLSEENLLLKQDIKVNNEDFLKSKDQINLLEQKNVGVQMEKEKLCVEMNTLICKCDVLEENNTKLEQTIKEKTEEYKTLSKEHLLLRQDMDNKNQTFLKLEDEYKNIEQKLVSVENEKELLCNEMNDFKKKTDELLEQSKSSSEKILKKKIEECKILSKETLLLRQDVNNKNEEILKLKNEFKNLDQELINILQEKQAVCEVLEETKAKSDRLIMEKTEEYKIITEETLLLKQDIKNKNEEVLELKNGIKNLDQSIREKTEAHNILNEEYLLLNQSIKNTEQKLVDVQNEKQTICNEMNSLKNQYKVLEESSLKSELIIKEKTEEHKVLNEELSLLKRDIKNKNKEFLKLEDEFKNIEQKLINVQNERETLCNELNNLKNKCEVLEEGKFKSELVIKEKLEEYKILSEECLLSKQELKNKNDEVFKFKDDFINIEQKLIDVQNEKQTTCNEMNNLKNQYEVLEESNLKSELIIKEKTEEHKVLNEELSLLRQDMKNKKEEFLKLEDKFKNVEQKLIDVQNERETLRNELNNLKNKCEVLEEGKFKSELVIKEKLEEYKILSEERLIYQQELKNKNDEVFKLKDDFINIEQKLIDVQNEKKTICNEMNNLKNQYEVLEESKLKSELIIKGKTEEHKVLNEECLLLKQDMKNKNEEFSKLKDEFKNIEQKLIDVQNERETLCNELNKLKNKSEVLEETKLKSELIIKEKTDKHKVLNEEISLLKQDMENKNQEFLEFEDKFKIIQQKLTDVQNEKQTLIDEIINLKINMKALNENKFRSEQIIKENTEKHNILSEETLLLKQDMKNKNEEVLQLNNEIKVLEQNLIDVRNEKVKLCNEINNLKSKCELIEESELKSEQIINKLTKDHKILSEENMLLKQDIKVKNDELSELKNEMTRELCEKETAIKSLKMEIENFKEIVQRETFGVSSQDKGYGSHNKHSNTNEKDHDPYRHEDATSFFNVSDEKGTITDLEKIVLSRNRTITTLQSDITYLKTLIAESETKLLDVTKELEIANESYQQISNQLQRLAAQKNEEIADLRKQISKMSATETRASQIVKVSAKYQTMILKRIAEIKNVAVLKELKNFNNVPLTCDDELRRGLTAGAITMDDLENFLETTDRHLKRCSERQIALQKERDRLAEVCKINDSEIVDTKKYLTELALYYKTFASVRDAYGQKLSRVVSLQRTVRREILECDGHVDEAITARLERGHGAVLQDLCECAMTMERWVERCVDRTVAPDKINQAFSNERVSLAGGNFHNAGLEVQFQELEKSLGRLSREVTAARKAGRATTASGRDSATVMEVRAEYEDKLDRMKTKMKQLYQEQITLFREKHRSELQAAEAREREAVRKLTASSRAYEEHIRGLTAELWQVGEKFLMKNDEAEWLKKKSGSVMSLPFVNSSGLTAPREDKPRPSDTQSLQSLPIVNKARTLHMSDEEGEMFDNRYLKELMSTPRSQRQSPPPNVGPRLSELKWRNSLCPPHLKSSYPAETQFAPAIDEEDIKNLTLNPTKQRKEVGITAYKKPGPPTPSKQAGRLSATDSELREYQRQEFEVSAKKTGTPSRFLGLFRSNRHDDNTGTPRRRVSLFSRSNKK